jgi:hypothetical protein
VHVPWLTGRQGGLVTFVAGLLPKVTALVLDRFCS